MKNQHLQFCRKQVLLLYCAQHQKQACSGQHLHQKKVTASSQDEENEIFTCDDETENSASVLSKLSTVTVVEDNSPEKDNNTGILYAKKVYSNLCISKKFSRIM